MPITVPGDFIPKSSTSETTEDNRRHLLTQLMEKVERLAPIPSATYKFTRRNVPDKLIKANFVFMRDSDQKSLQSVTSFIYW